MKNKLKDIKPHRKWQINPVERVHNPRKKEEKWTPRKALEELEENGDFDKFNLEEEN